MVIKQCEYPYLVIFNLSVHDVVHTLTALLHSITSIVSLPLLKLYVPKHIVLVYFTVIVMLSFCISHICFVFVNGMMAAKVFKYFGGGEVFTVGKMRNIYIKLKSI